MEDAQKGARSKEESTLDTMKPVTPRAKQYPADVDGKQCVYLQSRGSRGFLCLSDLGEIEISENRTFPLRV